MAKDINFFCENCGALVSGQDDRCGKCGKKFGGVKCPRCGYTGSTGEFAGGCPKCHYQLASEAKGSDEASPNNLAQAKRTRGERRSNAWPLVIAITAVATLSILILYMINYA
ncbi:MAG: hypothetical protein FWE37_03755 [Spirochaetaceae bacterium]|nr:hypothetical protein [Spirochaetaceae bacterium]